MEGDKGEQQEDGKSALYHAVVTAVAYADWEMARFGAKNAQNLKTTALGSGGPQDVAVVKRRGGGQPGNCNALKSGHHAAAMKMERRSFRSLKRRAGAAVATVEGYLGKKKRGRPSKLFPFPFVFRDM